MGLQHSLEYQPQSTTPCPSARLDPFYSWFQNFTSSVVMLFNIVKKGLGICLNVAGIKYFGVSAAL